MECGRTDLEIGLRMLSRFFYDVYQSLSVIGPGAQKLEFFGMSVRGRPFFPKIRLVGSSGFCRKSLSCTFVLKPSWGQLWALQKSGSEPNWYF